MIVVKVNKLKGRKMPNVNGKKFPYTKAGMMAAKKVMDKKKAKKPTKGKSLIK